MQTVTCPRCDGDGRYKAPSGYGPLCFRCHGTGRVKPSRARKVVKRELPPTRRIADICAGDPTKMEQRLLVEPSHIRALDYLGITPEQLATYADLWRQGVREVPR